MKKHFLIALFTLSLGIGVTIAATRYFAQLRQQERSLAAVSARLAFPANLAVSEDQSITVPLSMDTGGNTAIGVDLYVTFNPALLSLQNIEENTSSTFKRWLPVVNNTFDKPKVLTSAQATGLIKMSAVASEANGSKRPGFNGQLNDPNALVKFTFKPEDIATTTNTVVGITATAGSTTDSNVTVAEAENDALLSVQNLNLTINPIVIATIAPTLSPTLNPVNSPTARPTVVPTQVATATPIRTTSPTPISTPNQTIGPVGGSTIIVYASSTKVRNEYATMRVWVDGNFMNVSGSGTNEYIVNKSTNTDVVQPYNFDLNTQSPKKVRVYFTNDKIAYSPYEDMNLRVQKINVRGNEYLSTAPDVYSVGSCNSQGCGAGFKRREWIEAGWWTKNPPLLNTGYLEYTMR